MIVSVLEKKAGFYSEIFCMLNHYIHCKIYKITFVLDTINWLFKYETGWEDYFENINMIFPSEDNNCKIKSSKSYDAMQFFFHSQFIEPFSIAKYREAIREIYRYNNSTEEFINEIKCLWGFDNNTVYDAIFIRRGDKLYDESTFIPTYKYIEMLIQKQPNIQKIVLQTDDYNCVVDADKFLKKYYKHITLYTLCKSSSKGGMIIFSRNLTEKIEDKNTSDYIQENLKNLLVTRPVSQYSPSEIYEHTIDMICGVDFVLQSRTCVLDLQSNVSRFIRLYRNDNNVFDVVRLKEDSHNFDGRRDFNSDTTICPAFITSIYPEGFTLI